MEEEGGRRNARLQRNLHEIKFSTWLTGGGRGRRLDGMVGGEVTRPALPTCSFIIPGLITD